MRKSEFTFSACDNAMKTTDQIRQELLRASKARNRAKSMRLARQGLSATSPDRLQDWTFFRVTLARLLVTGKDNGDDGKIRTGEIEEAIQLYKEVLRHLSFRQEPRIWANAQLGLGLAYDQRLLGDKQNNLEKAIQHYEQSLKFFTRERHPDQWGEIEMAVAAAYSQRKRGNVLEHFRSAVKHYEEALKVFGQESDQREDIESSLDYLKDELAALAPNGRPARSRNG
jgi:tetratricopeptide (TPR) repeat protein